ncbi:hypothetical protein [Actinoplanes italicus]|uniref:hypothetical protein n=1 Tax=Actinoplanes italicus TaxID=113567 RepID=UPI0014743208|nr:hypothetical protein [Actinoplanes italicus]
MTDDVLAERLDYYNRGRSPRPGRTGALIEDQRGEGRPETRVEARRIHPAAA